MSRPAANGLVNLEKYHSTTRDDFVNGVRTPTITPFFKIIRTQRSAGVISRE